MNTDESKERKDDSPLTPGKKRAKTIHTEELWKKLIPQIMIITNLL